MDRDRVAPTALDHDRPAQERTNRRREHVEAPPEQRESRQLALEVGGPTVQLRPTVDEEADHAALERDRVGPADAQDRQARVRRGRAERLDGLGPAVTVDKDDRRDLRPRERRGQLIGLRQARRDDRERRRRG